jgi:hypothetical protein
MKIFRIEEKLFPLSLVSRQRIDVVIGEIPTGDLINVENAGFIAANKHASFIG